MTDEADLIGDVEAPRLRLEFGVVRSFAGNRRRDATAATFSIGDSASISTSNALTGRNSPSPTNIGRIGAGAIGGELVLGDAVVHDAHQCRRAADLGAEQAGDIVALEQKQIGAPLQEPFQRAIEAAADRAGTIDQRAAMRRVDADCAGRGRRKSRQRRALGAVAVKHVRRERV